MEFDPEFEETKIEFSKFARSVKRVERKDETDLLHGEEGGMIYKYDLPVVNLPMQLPNN